jgi:polar amino acid transport system substrate-binding protein
MRQPTALLAVAMAATILSAACQYPRDPEGTLDRVQGGTMRVGVAHNPPWVDLSGERPAGVEPRLIRRFAERIGVGKIDWVEGTETELVEAMDGFQLDVIIAGLTRSSPFMTEVALTRPYVDTDVEFAQPPGEDLPNDMEGVEIWVEPNSEAAALLQEEEEETDVIHYDELSEVDGFALLHTYEIDAIGYERTHHILRDDEHAMAVPMGENAFLIELEEFLLPRGGEANALLSEEVDREISGSR